MTEDISTGIVTEFFTGGWRVAPFIKTTEGYIGVKSWPKRAATNPAELQTLMEEQAVKSKKTPILGIVPTRGKYVVDIDTKKNQSALQLWKDKVAEAYGSSDLAIPNLVVKTKSGGFHLYYSDGTDRMLHSPTSIFSKDSGIDIRGYTGMVVAPTYIGTTEDWQLGEYVIIKGRPTDALTVLGLSKILGDSYDEADTFIKSLLSQVNEALRNDSVNELYRHRLIPDALIIPSSSRDNTLYKCARLCRLAGLSQDSAYVFMAEISKRCEVSAEEPAEHWFQLSMDKVKRVYANASEMTLQTVSGFYEELDNAGTVLLRGVSKTYYYFRHGSTLLNLEPRSRFSTENIANVLQGIVIKNDEGDVPVKKVVGGYVPKATASSAAMYPKTELPYFDFEGTKYVNTYHDPFAAFDPNPEMMEKAAKYVDKFSELVRHITGYEEGDDIRLLDKLAWIVQKPYRRMPTATIIYSHTRGSGKDVFMSLIREIVGRTYYMPLSLEAIDNPHTQLHDKLVCAVSEVQLQSNARGNVAAANFMGKVKNIITAKTVYVDEKFVQPFSAPIFANFFLLSNFELSALIEPFDRRFEIFHAAEEKLDQSRFGDLADIGNDGIWVERTAADRSLRQHVIYSIRRALAERGVSQLLDREEAIMNQVKINLMEQQHPPALEWLTTNLPDFFTEECVQMACYFSPMRLLPEYAMKQLREHYGPQMLQLMRGSRVIHRLNGSPKFGIRSDGSNRMPMLDFGVRTGDPTTRRAVYYMTSRIRDVNPSDSTIRANMKAWYESMLAKYYGNTMTLPADKSDAGPAPDLV